MEGGIKRVNRARRTTLKKALKYLDFAADLIREAKDDEQLCLDNLPENLQDSERSETMERAIESLEDAIDRIYDAKESIDCAAA